MLKFGRLVDLEKLETVSVNKLAEEIKEQLRTQEFASAKEIASWEVRYIYCLSDPCLMSYSNEFLKGNELIIYEAWFWFNSLIIRSFL